MCGYEKQPSSLICGRYHRKIDSDFHGRLVYQNPDGLILSNVPRKGYQIASTSSVTVRYFEPQTNMG